MDLLFHVSDKKLDTLEGSPLYFSKNSFISDFGKFIYIFDFNQLKKHFIIKRQKCGSMVVWVQDSKFEAKVKSRGIRSEYIINGEIPVKEFSIGVVKHLNTNKCSLKDVAKKLIKDEYGK